LFFERVTFEGEYRPPIRYVSRLLLFFLPRFLHDRMGRVLGYSFQVFHTRASLFTIWAVPTFRTISFFFTEVEIADEGVCPPLVVASAAPNALSVFPPRAYREPSFKRQSPTRGRRPVFPTHYERFFPRARPSLFVSRGREPV